MVETVYPHGMLAVMSGFVVRHISLKDDLFREAGVFVDQTAILAHDQGLGSRDAGSCPI